MVGDDEIHQIWLKRLVNGNEIKIMDNQANLFEILPDFLDFCCS